MDVESAFFAFVSVVMLLLAIFGILLYLTAVGIKNSGPSGPIGASGIGASGPSGASGVSTNVFIDAQFNPSTQSIPGNTVTALSFPSVTAAAGGFPAPSSTSTVFTPNKAGYYLVTYFVSFPSPVDTLNSAFILRSDNTRFGQQSVAPVSGAGMSINGADVVSFDGTQTFSIMFDTINASASVTTFLQRVHCAFLHS